MIKSFTGQYRFLSNFFSCRIAYDGAVYRSVEHAYQAAKTRDARERARVSDAVTPALAKRIGRHVTLRADWEQVKIAVMRALLETKFRQEPLRTMLVKTDAEGIVEGNTWGDQFWGKAISPAHPDGVGENHLGRLLMEIRAHLQREVGLGRRA